MKKRFLFLAAVTSSIVAPLFLATNALAQAKSFPSHCQPGEFAHINAKMGSFDLKTNLIKNGKILSLCADKAKEPFGKFIYRYGAIGNVELEQIATPQDKFFVFSRSLGPRMGEDIIYFTKGEYSFYISEATGMGSGIGLYAFKSGKKILDLFSGNDQDSDFQASGLVNPEKASSPVFVRRAPKDKI